MLNCVDLWSLECFLLASACEANGNQKCEYHEADMDNFVVSAYNWYGEGFAAAVDHFDKDGVWLKYKRLDPDTTWEWSEPELHKYQDTFMVSVLSGDAETGKTTVEFVEKPWSCEEKPDEYFIFAESKTAAIKRAENIAASNYNYPVDVVVNYWPM